MKYKVDDKVLFTFLGQKMRGIVLDKLKDDKYRIKETDGTIYSFILASEPKPVKKESNNLVLGYIINKL